MLKIFKGESLTQNYYHQVERRILSTYMSKNLTLCYFATIIDYRSYCSLFLSCILQIPLCIVFCHRYTDFSCYHSYSYVFLGILFISTGTECIIWYVPVLSTFRFRAVYILKDYSQPITISWIVLNKHPALNIRMRKFSPLLFFYSLF